MNTLKQEKLYEITTMEKNTLNELANLASKVSDEVYDDNNENGTQGILNLCDKLVEKIDRYLGNDTE